MTARPRAGCPAVPGARVLRARGLTLIEVMVALTIFALLSGAAYRGLQAVLDARARVDQETRKWGALVSALTSVQQSLAAAVDRPVRDRTGSIAPSLSGLASMRVEEEPPLEFTRMGFEGHQGVLGDLQRVGYRVRGERLEQLVWPVLDQAPSSRPHVVELMTGVAGMSLRYLAPDTAWSPAWPVPGGRVALPAAVEMTLRLKTGEEIARVFALP
ncbi:MAG TPA: type II secretion system minor pseudopilin GspJ [Burkholderiales bacterium]|nr:type II secretion system minor pseudopilin GspJ [Burkholderiales bacterium]